LTSLDFEFGQTEFKTAYLRVTDSFKERYSPPEDIINKPKPQQPLKLDMVGFEMLMDPFGF